MVENAVPKKTYGTLSTDQRREMAGLCQNLGLAVEPITVGARRLLRRTQVRDQLPPAGREEPALLGRRC